MNTVLTFLFLVIHDNIRFLTLAEDTLSPTSSSMQTSYSPEFIATAPLSRSYTMFSLKSVSSSSLDWDESIFMDSSKASSSSIGSSSSRSTGRSSSKSPGSSSSSSTDNSSSSTTDSSSSSSTGSSISSSSSSVTLSKSSSSNSASSSSLTSTTLRDVNEYTPTPAFSICASSSTREDPEILIEYLEQALAQDHISRRKRRQTRSSNVHGERFRAVFINLASESSSSPDNKDFNKGTQMSNHRRTRTENLALKKMMRFAKKRRYSKI